MNRLITDGVYKNAAIQPAKPALITKCMTHTYETLAQAIKARAAYLTQKFQPEKGEFIMLAMPNSHLFVEWFLAICEAGCIAVPVNPTMKKEEWAGIVERYHPSLIVAEQQVTADDLPNLSISVIASDTSLADTKENLNAQLNRTLQKDSDIFYMALSSGTTGTPKGILRTHRSWVTSFYAMSAEFGLGREDSILLPGPLYYSATLISLLHLLCIGGTVRLMDDFDAAQVLQEMQAGRTTSVFMVPTMYTAVLNEWERLNENQAPIHPPVRTLITAGAKMDDRLKEKVQEAFAYSTLYEYYGAAEIGFVTVQAGRGCTGSVGHAFHGVDVRIRNDTGDVVAVGEVGEIFARSEMMAEGYYGNSASKNENSQPEWRSAGDLGRIDDKGILYLVGRKSEMFISGGINIHPAEIEVVLKQIGFIREAAVFGIPDSYWGEKAAAALLLDEPPDNWEKKLREMLRERLASYKIPKVFFRVESMPLNSAGKIHKSELLTKFSADKIHSTEGGTHE
jgi:long-chain acyl-CoA synthetase